MARLVNGLGTKLAVGLFTGDTPEAPTKTMSPDGVITDKETLREHPPDILLTNYKMLDFLLMRPKDQPLDRILSRRDALVAIDGLEEADLNALVESELEQRFIDLLPILDAGIRLMPELVDGGALDDAALDRLADWLGA